MKLKKIIPLALTAAMLSGAAHAATVVGSFSEGARDQVAGTTLISGDATDAPPGYNLGTINGDEAIDLHGRMVAATDYYEFTSTQKFRISWLFGGYDLENPGSAFYTGAGCDNETINGNGCDDNSLSGLTARDPGSSDSPTDVFLQKLPAGAVVPAAGNTFLADITSGNASIFGIQSAGTYRFLIDGTNRQDANYDIRIQAVPLPAGGLLLLSALGGLGLARRRRK